jgi:hypothetical protein
MSVGACNGMIVPITLVFGTEFATSFTVASKASSDDRELNLSRSLDFGLSSLIIFYMK